MGWLATATCFVLSLFLLQCAVPLVTSEASLPITNTRALKNDPAHALASSTTQMVYLAQKQMSDKARDRRMDSRDGPYDDGSWHYDFAGHHVADVRLPGRDQVQSQSGYDRKNDRSWHYDLSGHHVADEVPSGTDRMRDRTGYDVEEPVAHRDGNAWHFDVAGHKVSDERLSGRGTTVGHGGHPHNTIRTAARDGERDYYSHCKTVPRYAQCGGDETGTKGEWPGICCESGYKCTKLNQWHWQCQYRESYKKSEGYNKAGYNSEMQGRDHFFDMDDSDSRKDDEFLLDLAAGEAAGKDRSNTRDASWNRDGESKQSDGDSEGFLAYLAAGESAGKDKRDSRADSWNRDGENKGGRVGDSDFLAYLAARDSKGKDERSRDGQWNLNSDQRADAGMHSSGGFSGKKGHAVPKNWRGQYSSMPHKDMEWLDEEESEVPWGSGSKYSGDSYGRSEKYYNGEEKSYGSHYGHYHCSYLKFWDQCGGLSVPHHLYGKVDGVDGAYYGYCCPKGSTCQSSDKWYYQCRPAEDYEQEQYNHKEHYGHNNHYGHEHYDCKVIQKWQQCGGKTVPYHLQGYVHGKDGAYPGYCCERGTTCQKGNEWYYQCRPSQDYHKDHPTPEPEKYPTPGPEKYPTPEPEKKYPTPEPENKYPTPEPENKYPTPEPENKYPTPESESKYPTPEPENKYPTPEPENKYPTPEPENKYPTPEPEKYPTPEPEKKYPTPEPEKKYPTPEPEKKYPTPDPYSGGKGNSGKGKALKGPCKNVLAKYDQCGGMNAPTGVTPSAGAWADYCCQDGTHCKSQNHWYSQCL